MSGIDQSVLVAAMRDTADAIAAIREIAEGNRAQMLANGWSETIAEQASAHTFIALVNQMTGGAK